MQSIKNNTVNVLENVGVDGSFIVSYAKSFAQSGVEGVTSISSYLIPSGSKLSGALSGFIETSSGLLENTFSGAVIILNSLSSLLSNSIGGIWILVQGAWSSLSGIPAWSWSQVTFLGESTIRIMPSFSQDIGVSTIPSKIQYGLNSLITATSDMLSWVFLSSMNGLKGAAYSAGNGSWEFGVYVVSGVTSALSSSGNIIQGTLGTFKTTIGEGIGGFSSSVGNRLEYVGSQLGNGTQFIIDSTIGGISYTFGGAFYALENIGVGVKDIVNLSVTSFVEYVGNPVWTSMSSLPIAVANASSNVVSNYLKALGSGFEVAIDLFSSMISALGTLDILFPIKWIWMNTWTFVQSLLEYVFSSGTSVGTSLEDLVKNSTSSIAGGCGNFLSFLQSSSSSSLESAGQMGKDSIFYIGSLPYTALTGIAGYGTEAVTAMGSGLGYLLASAWERSNNYFRPKQQAASQETTINYEILIERVLNSDKFLDAVSQIANSKVDTESVKFQEQLTTMMNAGKVAQEKESFIVEQYKSRIDGIKVEVSNEIKKMTEEFVKSNLITAEAKASEQDTMILNLKEKYQQMLLDAEVTKQGINTHTETIAKSNLEMQNQIEDLKAQISNLEVEQKALNLTMSGCCKNITAIEITVEHYINDLLQNIIESKSGGEGKPTENFAAWVNTYFIAKSEIETRLTALTADIDSKIQHHMDTELRDVAKSEAQQTAQQIMDTVSNNIRVEYAQRVKEAQANKTEVPVGGLNKEEVFKIVKSALIQYDADKTGMFDYALETAGGSVVSTRCTETYIQKTAMYSIFGIPIWYPSNNPRTIIQPGVQPGECWAFKGSSGFVVIQLSEGIVPTKFSMEHISKSMSPSGKIDSAPKDFVVYGLRHEKDHDPVKLGKYSYSQDQDPLQFYEVMFPSKDAFPYIELDIVSNHGNLNYTCLYRFRVHGVLP